MALDTLTAFLLFGDVGYWAAAYYNPDFNQLPVSSVTAGEADLGFETRLGRHASGLVKLKYWDLMGGAWQVSSAPLSLAAANITVAPFLWLSATLGRQTLQYGEGLFLSDLSRGSDGVRVRLERGGFWLDGIALIANEGVLRGPCNCQYTVLYGSARAGDFTIQPYGAARYGIFEQNWAGGRAEFSRQSDLFGLKAVAELARYNEPALFCTPGDAAGAFIAGALSLTARVERLALGGGYYHFDEGWVSPLQYGYVMEGYYNGWVGFGEAMTWSGLSGTVLKQYITSYDRTDPRAVFWDGTHNLRVFSGKVKYSPLDNLGVRLDIFSFLFQRTPPEFSSPYIGTETALNLVYILPPGVNLGLSGGLLFPSASVYGAADSLSSYRLYYETIPGAAPWAVKLWAWTDFEAPLVVF